MDHVAPLLKELATQLGVTVEYLWPYLVSHKRVTVLWQGIISPLMLILFVYGWHLMSHQFISIADRYDAEFGRGMLNIAFALSFFLIGWWVIASFSSLPDALYPEAAVIKDLLTQVK